MNGIITYPLKRYFNIESVYTTALSGPPSAVRGHSNVTPKNLHFATAGGGYWQPEIAKGGMGKNAIVRARGIHIQPVGTDAANETINFRIVGWRKFVGHTTDVIHEYRATVVWVGQATLGTNAGIANGGYGTSLLFADTITETTAIPTGLSGLSNFSVNIYSPADNTDAFVTIEDVSHIFDGFTFDTDLGTAASANLLIGSVF